MSKFLYVSLSGDAIAYLGGKKGSNELLKKFKEMFISINKARTCAKDCIKKLQVCSHSPQVDISQKN